jgi:large subunit ribosomal protein L28
MAKSDLTGTGKLKGNKVSHSNIKTKRWQNPNLQERRIFVPELKRFIRLRLTTREIRTLDKLGLMAFAKKLGLSLEKL